MRGWVVRMLKFLGREEVEFGIECYQGWENCGVNNDRVSSAPIYFTSLCHFAARCLNRYLPTALHVMALGRHGWALTLRKAGPAVVVSGLIDET